MQREPVLPVHIHGYDGYVHPPYIHTHAHILHMTKIKEKKKMQDIVLFVLDFSWDYYPETWRTPWTREEMR